MIILMHGFGAPGDDLVAIGELLLDSGALPKTTRFVFPEAPLELETGYGDARAWWMIDIERRIEMLRAGQVEALVRETPDGMPEARKKMIAVLEHLTKNFHAGDQVFLGGFSQGSMLAVDVALHIERKLAGLVLWSGTLLSAEEWTKLAPKRRGLPIFQSHGTRDPILPFPLAKSLAELFRVAGAEVEFHEFTGQHEIPRPVLAKLIAFLARVSSRPAPAPTSK